MAKTHLPQAYCNTCEWSAMFRLQCKRFSPFPLAPQSPKLGSNGWPLGSNQTHSTAPHLLYLRTWQKPRVQQLLHHIFLAPALPTPSRLPNHNAPQQQNAQDKNRICACPTTSSFLSHHAEHAALHRPVNQAATCSAVNGKHIRTGQQTASAVFASWYGR
jgi:hypothetical protein